MGTKLLRLPDVAKNAHKIFGFCDQFDHFVTTDRWTSILTDSGSAAVTDAQGGVLAIITSDGTETDNDEAYIHTTHEMFKFEDDKPLVVEAMVQYTEANTDDANILFGVMDAAAANHLQDDGAGPAASYSGAVFFKVDGGTKWQVESSVSTTQTTSQTSTTAGGASYQRLRIEFHPYSNGQDRGEIAFFVDDQQVVLDSDNSSVIKHFDFDYSSATEMDVIIGAKNGGANKETLNVKYCFAYQKHSN